MEYIDIDNRDKNPSYDDIFEAFRIIGHNLDQKYYWSNGDEVTDSNKISYLGELMSYIEDEELLNGAIDYFKNMNFVVDIGLDSEEEINMNLLCYADSDFDKLINKFPQNYFSNIELIKIKAIVYSLFVRYDILITDYSFINLNWERFPILITLNDRFIEHNFYNVIDSIDRNGMIKYINDIKKSPINEQIASIHNAISVCIDINHKNNSNSQSNSIEYLKKTLKNLVSMSKSVAIGPQPPTHPEDEQGKARKEKEFLSNQITHLERVKIAKAIKDKYSSYQGKDFKILYEALLKLDLFPKKGKRQMFYRCLQNEGYSINSHQLLEDIYFATGTYKKGGDYEKSADEIRRDTIIDYLETIINTK